MHTDEIYKLATSSGKLPILAEAFDHVLHTATLYDVPLTARYLKSDLLSYDRLHLAEHHLYGSSRLGIQRYLPSEYSYTASSTEGSTYDRLPESRSWYSRYANDLFSSGLSSNALTSYNLSLSDLPLFNHILGNRQFELTNHLGNVQSTVLDRTHPRIGFAGNGSVITGYQANIASAQDYFPFGMYMPGRYISDTVQHCITVTKRIRVPRFMPWRFFPVTSYPPVFGTLSTHVFRYGDPVVPGVHELSKATLMAEEKPYVYHLLPASQHIGGAVLKAAAGPDSTAEYTIDLGGEPAPVYSYLHLHPDTALAIQSLNVTVHHSPGVLVEARIRQYNASGVEDFSVPLDWQPLPEGQPYALDFATDVTAIVAGGATMLEYRTSPVGGGTFAAASEVTYTATIVTVSLSELRDVLVTICDEKDNYRFGFNGMEKDNEVKGIGNSLDFGARIYDSRIGRFLSLDPDRAKYPFQSPFVYANNTPIQAIDEEGKGAGYAVLKFLAQQTHSTVAVGTAVSASYAVGMSSAAGIAVDPKGNVALFASASIATLDQTTFNLNKVAVGANANVTVGILPFKDVTAVSGSGTNVGVSAYVDGVGGGVSADFSVSAKGEVSFQGFTGSLGVGTPGGSVGVGGAQATNAILLSENDYKTITQADKVGVNTAMDWNRSVNDDMSNPSGFWEYTGSEVSFSPIEGQKDAYDVGIKMNFSYSTSGLGASQGQRNQQVTKTVNTNITVRKVDVNTYRSDNLVK